MNNSSSSIDKKTEIVSISEEKDLIYWTIRLGITTEVLKSAIRATRCVNLNDIFIYLDKKDIKHFA
jgi:hypothetical protein